MFTAIILTFVKYQILRRLNLLYVERVALQSTTGYCPAMLWAQLRLLKSLELGRRKGAPTNTRSTAASTIPEGI
jgi:hypothetical protein